MATDAETLALGFDLPSGADLISLGDNSITRNAKAAVDLYLKYLETLPWKGIFSSTVNVNTLPDGIWKLNAARANLQAVGLPSRLGNILNFTHGSGGFTQLVLTATTTSYGMELWGRSSDGIGGTAVEPNFQRIYPPVRPTRTAAIELTHPRGSDTDNRTLLQVRVPVTLPVDVPRGRFILRNYDYKSDTPYPGVVDFQGIAFGRHQMNADGSMTGLFPVGEPPTVLRTSFSSPADASSFGTEWDNLNVKAGEYLLSFAYTAPEGQVNAFQLGTCFTNGILGSWIKDGVTTSVYQGFCPFSIHMEVSVDAETPVYMYVGDSMLAGLNSHRPVVDSWARAHAAEHGGIAQVLAQPGGSLAEFADPQSPKLRKFEHLAAPDRIYMADGYNDITNGATLATVQQRFSTAVQNIRAKYPADLYLTTIQPRAIDPTQDTVRLPYNDWLRSLPENAVAVSDHYAAVVDPATGKTDSRWQASPGDSHLKKAGYMRLAQATDALTQQIPSPYVVTESAGRVVKIWDYLNAREQLVYGETGIRNITSLATVPIGGTIELSRFGNLVTLRFDGVKTLGKSLLNLLYLPTGFRAHTTTNYWLTAGASANAPDRSVQLYASGNTRINSADVVDDYRQTFTFKTNDPWPTSLPGVSA